jgi:hypothetical protein
MPLSKLKKWISGRELMERWKLDAINLSAAILEHNIIVYNYDNLKHNYFIWHLNVTELSQEIAEYFFRADDIIDFEKMITDKSADIKDIKDKKLTKNQRHREQCRTIAESIWKSNPDTTIAYMAINDEITGIACEGKLYAEKTIRDWVKDLCPNRDPGRRPKPE